MQCPSCKTKNTKFAREYQYISQKTKVTLPIQVYECSNCGKLYATTKRSFLKTDYLKCDNSNLMLKCPKFVQELSPKAFNFYRDSLVAKISDLKEFAGVGLRMALENLIYDYLIKILGLKEVDISNLSLKQMCDKMTGSKNYLFYADICCTIIRVFGNDSVHIKRNYPEIKLNDAFDCYETLCTLIESEKNLLTINEKYKKKNQGNA